jgi:hypothetical protein
MVARSIRLDDPLLRSFFSAGFQVRFEEKSARGIDRTVEPGESYADSQKPGI